LVISLPLKESHFIKGYITITNFGIHVTEDRKICEEPMKYAQSASTYIKISLGYINNQTFK